MKKVLEWFLTPPTILMWANWHLMQWDMYVEASPYAKSHPLILSSVETPIQFKQANE